MAIVKYSVTGMTCQVCANAVKKSVSSLPGTRSAEVDLDAKEVQVEYNEAETSPEEILRRIEDAGFEAEGCA